jgi:hypothetical protein
LRSCRSPAYLGIASRCQRLLRTFGTFPEEFTKGTRDGLGSIILCYRSGTIRLEGDDESLHASPSVSPIANNSARCRVYANGRLRIAHLS